MPPPSLAIDATGLEEARALRHRAPAMPSHPSCIGILKERLQRRQFHGPFQKRLRAETLLDQFVHRVIGGRGVQHRLNPVSVRWNG